MKKLVKRMLKPYHLELGCVEAYESNAPATSGSDTTKVTDFKGEIEYFTEQDSVHVSGEARLITIAGGDTIRVETRQVNFGTSKKTAQDSAGFGKKRATGWGWDKIVDIFNEWFDDT